MVQTRAGRPPAEAVSYKRGHSAQDQLADAGQAESRRQSQAAEQQARSRVVRVAYRVWARCRSARSQPAQVASDRLLDTHPVSCARFIRLRQTRVYILTVGCPGPRQDAVHVHFPLTYLNHSSIIHCKCSFLLLS